MSRFLLIVVAQQQYYSFDQLRDPSRLIPIKSSMTLSFIGLDAGKVSDRHQSLCDNQVDRNLQMDTEIRDVRHTTTSRFFIIIVAFVIVTMTTIGHFYMNSDVTVSYSPTKKTTRTFTNSSLPSTTTLGTNLTETSDETKNLLLNVYVSNVIGQMVKSSRRFYLHDFEFNSMLAEWQTAVNSTSLYKYADPRQSISGDKVIFLVLGSVATKHKSKNVVDSWLSMARHFYIFADQNDSTIPNFMTLPEIVGKPTREDAQHRQLRGMKWLWANNTNWTQFNWFVLADDDTWMNIPALLHFLSPYSADLPVAFGYVWDNIWEANRIHFSGGSGMVLSRTAFSRLAEHLYTPKIVFERFNDLTISNGCEALGIVQVHSDRFYWERVSTISAYGGFFSFPPNYVSRISFHYMNSGALALRMTCDAAKFWKFDRPKLCDNSTREASFLRLNSFDGMR